MKNLISILLMFVFFWLSSTMAFADVIFDDVNMTLHVPASKAEHELIVGFNKGQLSRREQRNALTRFHAELNIKYVKKGMTEWQRAEVALQKVNLLRQAGALTIQRVPTNRRLENITYEYVIIHQDAEINAGGGLLYFGDIDLQLKYLAALLGAEVDFDVDHFNIKAHIKTKSLINSADLFSQSDERNEDDLEDNRRFNDWWDWVMNWLDGLPDGFSGRDIVIIDYDGDLIEWCGVYIDHQGEFQEAHCAWW